MNFFKFLFNRNKELTPIEIEPDNLREEIREDFKTLLKKELKNCPDLAAVFDGNTHIFEFFYLRGRVDEAARISKKFAERCE